MVDIGIVLEQKPLCCVVTVPAAPVTILSLDRCELEAGKYRGQFLIFERLF
jgi:hypothetical protein